MPKLHQSVPTTPIGTIDKLDPDRTYNKCIFVVTETTAEEMLEGKIRIPEERAAVALLVPQADQQEHWKDFRPTQHQVFLQNRETKNLVAVQAWLLQLGTSDVQSTNEDTDIRADVPKAVEMIARLKKAHAEESLFKKVIQQPRFHMKKLLEEIGVTKHLADDQPLHG